MTETIMTIAGAACLTELWLVSEPTNLLRARLGFTDDRYADMGRAKAFLHRLMNCGLCSGFWIGLAVTLNPLHAALVAVLADRINRMNNG